MKPATKTKRMTDAQRRTLRAAIIAGPTDCPLTPDEAEVFMGRSVSYLRASDLPRADIGGPLYLKSELLKGVKAKLSHRIMEPTAT
jgi:hypothetical protein